MLEIWQLTSDLSGFSQGIRQEKSRENEQFANWKMVIYLLKMVIYQSYTGWWCNVPI
jgi:hypothetical protein